MFVPNLFQTVEHLVRSPLTSLSYVFISEIISFQWTWASFFSILNQYFMCFKNKIMWHCCFNFEMEHLERHDFQWLDGCASALNQIVAMQPYCMLLIAGYVGTRLAFWLYCVRKEKKNQTLDCFEPTTICVYVWGFKGMRVVYTCWLSSVMCKPSKRRWKWRRGRKRKERGLQFDPEKKRPERRPCEQLTRDYKRRGSGPLGSRDG